MRLNIGSLLGTGRTRRTRKIVAAGVLAAVAALVVVIAANASAGPVAPYDAFTVDGRSPSPLFPGAPVIVDPTNGFLSLDSQASGNGFGFHANNVHVLDALINAPLGATLATGTYATANLADATHAGLYLSVDGSNCAAGSSGGMTISQLDRNPDTHAITAFAAEYMVACTGQQPVYGSLRWKSTVGYTTAGFSAMALDFGTVLVGQSSASQRLTLTNFGSDPLTVHTAKLDNHTIGHFSLSANTCVGASVEYGQSCTIDITAHPLVGGDISGNLILTDNTAPDTHTVKLSVLGNSLALGEASPTSLDFGTVAVGQTSPARTVTITSTGETDLTTASPTITGSGAAAFSVSGNTCAGAAIAPGSTCAISVTAAPTAAGSFSATLTIPVNTTARSLTVDLSVVGPTQIDAAADPSSIDFGAIPVNQSSPVRTVTVTSTGTSAVTLQTAAITGTQIFSITADTCSGRTLSPHATCTLGVQATPPSVVNATAQLSIPHNGPGAVTVDLSASGIPGAAGTYYPLPPQRLMDTRTGNGAPKAPIGPRGVAHLQVSGRGGVPGTGVGAVVLNVTVTGPTVGGYVTVFPTGVPRPVASSLDFPRGWTGANSVTVKLGTGGKIDLFNLAGNTDLVVDVLGFYASSDAVLATNGLGGQFQPTIPVRLVDTRRQGGALAARSKLTVTVNFADPSINGHIRAFAVNITAVAPAGAGHLSAWSGAGAPPTSSTLNFTAGAIVPNMAIVAATPCTVNPACAGLPSIAIYNASSAATHVLVDLVGIFDDSTIDGGLRFRAMTPTRITDSRIGQGVRRAIGPRQTVTITAPPTVAGLDTIALATNVTAIAPTASTYLTVWPAGLGLPRPTVSNLNPAQGSTVANAVITVIGPDNQFNLFNLAGTVNVAIDVVGAFEPGITALPSTLASSHPQFRASRTPPHPLVPHAGPSFQSGSA